ncbi:flavoprotein [Micromonospora sp. S4605]|uniref:flavoprotein n=1 Tax=Micromonospora sp. S4605 TaxID=1420897 RepID=UPI000D6ECD0A|nr:flavoprotein [Micromonospora sp. S4605]PWU51688.1 flavoprotein [Micromonospora sp. S4605]
MPGKTRSPALHLIVCHTEPAAELAEFIAACQELGWQVHAVAAPAEAVDLAALTDLTGHPIRTDEQAQTLHPLPPADAYAVAPASFDLVNKWAYGLNDNLALRLLNEATSIGLPVVAVPAPDPAFARHPAFLESLERLRHWGVAVPSPAVPGDLDDPEPWHVAVRVIAAWTRFARVPAQQPAEPVRGVEELALQSG